MPSPSPSAPRVALVLGAGGPVGHAFHAGVLCALADAGWDARRAGLVVGTSIGAVTAALLRAGLAPADLFAHATAGELSLEGRDLLTKGWPENPFHMDLSRRRTRGAPSSLPMLGALLRRPGRLRASLVLTALSPSGEVPTDVITDGFGRVLGPDWPARAMRICATDLETGTRTVFGWPGTPDTDPATAVAASCAVPSYFAPVVVAGHRYVDGGTVSPSNVDVVAEDPDGPYDLVLVSVPMGLGGRAGRVGLDLPGRWLNTRQAAKGLDVATGPDTPGFLLAPSSQELAVMGYDAFDLDHLPDIARRARAATRRRLARDPALAEMVERLQLGPAADGGGPDDQLGERPAS